MAGCLSERYKGELQKDYLKLMFSQVLEIMTKIDLLVHEKSAFTNESIFNRQVMKMKRIITGSSYHTYVKLSEGCNQACSFCAIPSFKENFTQNT